jgi:hypothetical protein
MAATYAELSFEGVPVSVSPPTSVAALLQP